ncbi:MAG TPA: GNAT family N-acetyltransferase [Blastocatellia bacterium]|nr:GNAT family N-acetyltransferase [Blastocatellia bacterium]
MRVEVVPAGLDQQPVLANLTELYAHDFSEISELHLNSDGRFGYPSLPLYWQESSRHPFLVKVDDTLAGFVFVKKGSEVSGDENVWDVAEFFIVRGFRRLGIGMRVAHEVWRKFPGRWEVRVTQRNQAGLAFWSRAVASFMGHAVEHSFVELNGKHWHLFCFDAASAKPNRP